MDESLQVKRTEKEKEKQMVEVLMGLRKERQGEEGQTDEDAQGLTVQYEPRK